MNNKETVTMLCNELLAWLDSEKAKIFDLNQACTQDTSYTIQRDFEFIKSYLSQYYSNNSEKLQSQIKPKGKVIIILSYNEPLITSITPVLNALVAGNQVVVRPSTRGLDFFRYVWEHSNIISHHNLNLRILTNKDQSTLENELSNTQALYFFGGHKNAKTISQLCSKYFVEFYPEIEASDIKIINVGNQNESSIDLEKDIDMTLEESFSHAGQSCQRIHGVFIDENNYDRYSKKFIERFKVLCQSEGIKNFISPTIHYDSATVDSLNLEIKDSSPKEIINNGESYFPILVLEPDSNSKFIQSAYFLPTIWLAKYYSDEDLLNNVINRPYHLGINIWSTDDLFINKIIEKTNYSRYTINTDHTRVRPEEGWGGMWPSGYSGYKNWIELFSNPYKIISK